MEMCWNEDFFHRAMKSRRISCSFQVRVVRRERRRAIRAIRDRTLRRYAQSVFFLSFICSCRVAVNSIPRRCASVNENCIYGHGISYEQFSSGMQIRNINS